MKNYTKFVKKNIMIGIKYLFHTSNILLIIFYLYPGSIFGCFLYNNCGIQPQLTRDFIFVSSNHIYVFVIVSLLGLIAYSDNKSLVKIVVYLFFISFFLELAHLYIPERGFEIKDLTGNIIGVVISLIIFRIIKIRKKNG